MTRSSTIVAAVTASALALPQAASAHGLGERSDLPLPGWLFAWGAALVLAVSFFAFAALWQTPKLETAVPKKRFRVPGLIEPICGAIGVLIFIGLVVAGLAGTQEISTNIVPTFVYVVIWTVIPLTSAIFGDWFKAFNPWRAIARLGSAARARLRPGRAPTQLAYPEALARWPAVILLFSFGWLELVPESGRDPDLLAILMLAYAAIQLAGMALFGSERWLERGDAFGLHFNFFSRISPLTVVDGRLATRLPLSGLTDIDRLPATVAFICTSIGITAFDGAGEGSLWKSIGGAEPSGATMTLGLLAVILIVAGFYRLGVAGMRSSHIDMPARDLARNFAPSLVPIMVGYVLAHYFSFVLFQGAQLYGLISDPAGVGWNLFGTSYTFVFPGFVSNNVIWWVQVAALVAGHVAGLAVAHDKALALWGKARAAAQSQMWMLVVMVGFTSLGLWLLSQANA